MIADFHMHSYFSGDSKEIPKKMIETAINLGMHNMCFTDHQDFDYAYEDISFELEDERYFSEISELKQKYADKINVGIGVEIGLEARLWEKTEQFAKKHPYDFIIGSAHLVNGEDPYYPDYFITRGVAEGIRTYFDCILKTLDVCSDFDVYGHLDYVVRYAPQKNYSYAEYKEQIDEILKKLIHSGKGIELNTGGLYKGMKNTNPIPDIIKRYKELGGEIITIGSDAHSADFIGYGFNQAKEILENAWFSKYTVFKNREPHFIKL